MKRHAVIIATVLTLALQASPLFAQTPPPDSRPDFTADLVVGGSDRNDPNFAWVGVQVRLGPGWHTYWRAPGDAGAAPEFDWRGSRNVATATVEWPAPHRYTVAGIDTFGYAKAVLFPVKLHLRDRNAPTQVSLKLTLYVCSSICTQSNLHLTAAIAPGARFDNGMALIDHWRAKVPRAHESGLAITSLRLLSAPSPRLRIVMAAKPPLTAPDVFIDGDSAIEEGRPQVTKNGDGGVITLPLKGISPGHPDKPLQVTLVDGTRAVEAVLPAQPGTLAPDTAAASVMPVQIAPQQAPPARSLTWSMIAVALVGGLILNVMPCVFPILSLKLFTLLAPASRDLTAIRTRFLASAAGVIASFALLATVLGVLKTAGAQIGWGIQFQQPLFLLGMTAVLVALAANLLDLYEIHLPWRLATLFGQSAGGESVTSHFFNGFIMTLLATPCSAPFVGTAVGFGLSQGTAQIFAIFLALGVGMAAPYLLLAMVPQVGRFFPRPGPWMLVFRRVAAIALAGTAIWLLTILAEISGARTALMAGTSFGLAVWAVAIYRRRFVHAVAGTLIVGLAAVAIVIAGGKPNPAATAGGVHWQTFAPQKVKALVKHGRTVFVDIGAAWCVTCKVNERLIVDSAAIRQRLARDVAPVRADWTKPNATIAAYLQSFGRFGLPFNAVFGPGAPDGIVLPELLTQNAVLAAFNVASAEIPSH